MIPFRNVDPLIEIELIIVSYSCFVQFIKSFILWLMCRHSFHLHPIFPVYLKVSTVFQEHINFLYYKIHCSTRPAGKPSLTGCST